MKDYYKILHVAPNASIIEIEEAYRRLSEEYRPQEHYAEDSYHVRYYKEIQEAYKILSDPDKRAAYTKELAENQEKIEDMERRQREEGFGEVLKMFLKEPHAEAKPTKTTASSYNRAHTYQTNTSYRKPMIFIIAAIIILALSIVVLLNFDSDNKVAESPPETNVAETANENESGSLLEDNLYGTGEENYEPEEEEDEGENSPYQLDAEVSAEMASYSLQDCLQLLSRESVTFEKKEDAIARALQFFEGNNANVVVLGSNNVQIRRETIEDYLFILMLQGYDIQIVDTEKTPDGKISKLSVKEIL